MVEQIGTMKAAGKLLHFTADLPDLGPPPTGLKRPEGRGTR